MDHGTLNSTSALDVELAPQAQLLSRIQYLVNSDSQFNFLAGESGVGKSFISGLLVERLTNHLVIELKCRDKVNLDAFSQDLICQLATDDLSDINQSISDAINGAINYYDQSVLIVIDNAHFLSREFVGTLWHSFNQVVSSTKGCSQQLNILLIGHPPWVKPLVRQLKDLNAALVSSFELPYLSVQQSIDFMTAIHPDWSDPKISDFVGSLNANQLTPNRLIYIEQPDQQQSKFKLVLIALICLIILLIGITGWWWLRPESVVIELSPTDQVPPQVVLAMSENTAPVVAIPQEQPVEQNITQPQQLVVEAPASADEASVAAEVVVEVTQPIAQKIAVPAVEALMALPQAEVSYRYQGAQLLEVSHTHVSLMLGGFSQYDVLERVMNRIEERHELYVYQTIRNDQDWYVLLYGDFASRAAAQQKLTDAPAPLATFSPWIKSFRAIHAEITAIAPATMDKNN